MKTDVVIVFLGLTVLFAWVGAIGFLRLHSFLDRLHCITFVNVACGLMLIGAALVGGGISSRSLKIIVIVAINVLSGAVTSHASARALVTREGPACRR